MRPINEGRMRAFEAIVQARPDLIDGEHGLDRAISAARYAADRLVSDERDAGGFEDTANPDAYSLLDRLAEETQELEASA